MRCAPGAMQCAHIRPHAHRCNAGVGGSRHTWLPGGNAAWQAAGFSTQQGESYLASPRIDRYRRSYEGSDNPALAMQAYLDWESGLVEQLKRDGTHHFKVI